MSDSELKEKLLKSPENYSTLDSGGDHPQPQQKRKWVDLLYLYNPFTYYLPRRYGIATLAFLGFCNLYSLRVNLSVAIVLMTTPTTGDAPAPFPWTHPHQGLILSAFFYGYICTQIPGGWLANKLGGKRVFGFGILTSSFLAMVTPVMTSYLGSPGLIAVRVAQGLAEGVVYPAIHAVWSKWAPVHERSRLATIAFSGSYVGTVIALPLSGFIGEKLGWQMIFYFFGFVALLWSFFWSHTVGESPQEDKRISGDEVDFIVNSTHDTVGHHPLNSHAPPPHPQNEPIPWKKILLSPPVWGINIAHFAENWGFYTLITFLPRFMSDIFAVELTQAGFLSALPYALMAVTVQVAGFLADYSLVHYWKTTVVRKLFTCGAFVAQTVFIVGAAYSGQFSGVWALACLSLSVGLGGFAWAGFGVNQLDVAPQFASVLMGVSNTFATIPGMVSPYLTGRMLGGGGADAHVGGVVKSTMEEWRGVFSMSATIYLVGAVLYGLLASGEVQPWARGMGRENEGEGECPAVVERAEGEESAAVK